MKRSAALFLVIALAASVPSCASRQRVQSAAVSSVSVTLRVRNNLTDPLTLRAMNGNEEIWNGSVGASATLEMTLGTLPSSTLISLRATTQQGTVVSARDSIAVREGLIIWTIP